MALDTYKAVKKLKEVGFDESQAEMVIRMIGEAFDDSVATKADIVAVRADLSTQGAELRAEAKAIRAEIRDLEHRMTIKLGGLLVVALGLLTAINKWLG